MVDHLPSLKRLVLKLQRVPYLASKNLYRVAAYLMESKSQDVEELCKAILQAHKQVKPCSQCFNWAEGAELCALCAHPSRDKSSICVVETCYDLLSIERTRVHKGLYHVLGGSLCPLDGIGPEDLTIKDLIARLEDGEVRELVFATNPTPEGEATASYIATKVGSSDIRLSKLASGLPTGASLEYMDGITIQQAFSGRRPF